MGAWHPWLLFERGPCVVNCSLPPLLNLIMLNTLGLQCRELVGNCCFSALVLSEEMVQLEPIFQPLGPETLRGIHK